MPNIMLIGLYLAYSAVLLYVGWVDIQTRRIPNRVVIPAILLALLAMPGTIGVGLALPGAIIAPLPLVIGRLVSGAGKMGMGDIKLAVFIGLILGYQLALAGVAIALVLSLLFGLVGVARGTHSMRSKLPFAPFLAAGSLPFLVLLHLPL